ncbi:MAG: cytoplasmic iron level regulating protein YaaA (DUF328/UPF0246 family) [Bacteroidia bacterium]|jgi:cytoplasmic iron level regulating protein YaaA (DUF328/UPF0246 family)
MIAIISPAKRLDLKSDPTIRTSTIPDNLDQSEQLITKLRKTSGKKIKELMGISAELTQLNVDRYATWSPVMTTDNARQAIFTFDGEVYRGIDIPNLSEKDLNYAQDHLSILSGLHGLLRPLDLIKPYRLEMGTKLPIKRKKNLYEFWGDSITDRLTARLEATGSSVMVNLASSEYFKAINFKKLNARVIEPVFMDLKNGEFKVLFAYAKLARGYMTGYMLRNQLKNPEGLKDFAMEGYRFSELMSEGDRWVFTR